MIQNVSTRFKVFSDIMSLVNFTSLQFSQCFSQPRTQGIISARGWRGSRDNTLGTRLCFSYKFAVFHNCQKHLNDKTHSHRNSFHLNPFSQAVASEIVIDQLQITNCKKISFRTMVQDIVKYRQLL